MFRLNHWNDPQTYKPRPFDRKGDVPQSIRQVWFAGVHSDVGGGYPESESGLSKYPLAWMVGEAEAAGLETRPKLKAMLVDGEEVRPGSSTFGYVPPSPTAALHKSLTGAWWLLEPLPKWYKLKEWPRRIVLLFFYFPWAEPRPIPNRPWDGKPSDQPFFIHSSVLARIAALGGYRPVNLPAKFDVETAAGPPVETIPPPPYREGLFARLEGLFTTWPGGKGWLGAAKEAAWLLPVLAVLAWWGGRLDWQPDFGTPVLIAALIALIVPALVEETVFRGVLLKPPSDGASALGPVVLSAVLFALWHPAQTWLYHPPWGDIAWSWWFIGACAALGFACARIVLATRSIWPAVALHWLVVVGWMALFGGPGRSN
jgi:membrane protease YdiL (CAAX protease family)